MSKKVKIGNLYIGGGEKPLIQSMTTFAPKDTENCINQIKRLQDAGCEIVRFCVADEADASSIKKIKDATKIPLVADVHFDYRLGILAVENGADKLRINPGNIGGEKEITAVADCLKAHKIPVRVGANSGSIEKELLKKYGVSVESLVQSAMNNVKTLEKHGVYDIVVSVKSSDVRLMTESYRALSKVCDYPLHIGVTEAGGGELGKIKNAVGIGALLLDGIGDTLRVSLSEDPVEEVAVAKNILRSVGIDKNFVNVISCPTCGRCNWDCMAFAKKVCEKTKNENKPLNVAVMGCVVNGVGEGKSADIGIAGGKDKAVIFKKGEAYAECSFEDAEEIFFGEIEKCLKWKK